jgi:hypothetical protein
MAKYISKYSNFLSDYLISESVILASDNLKDILSKTKTNIGVELFTIIKNQEDIDTGFNTLDLGTKNDELMFLPDVRTQKLLSDGEEPFSKTKQSMGIGRLVRSILSKNFISFTDKDLEEFVTEFKYLIDIKNNKTDDKIKLVSGDDIRYWYDEESYQSEGLSGTELGKSCMKYKKCQKYFGIYTENPNQCKLLIYLNEENKLIGRSLLWTLTNGNYYLDRIYTIHGSDKMVMVDWLFNHIKDKKIKTYYNYSLEYPNVELGRVTLEVNLDNGNEFDYYPYMDTLIYYTPYDNLLSERSGDLILQETDGGSRGSGVWCEFEGEEYPEDDTVYSEYHGVSMHRDNAKWSEYHTNHIWHREAVRVMTVGDGNCGDYVHQDYVSYSTHYKQYLISDDAVEVYTDIDANDTDYFLSSDRGELYEEDSFYNKFYVMKLLKQTDTESGYTLAPHVLKCFAEKSKNEYNVGEVFAASSSDILVSQLDAKIFNIEVGKEVNYDARVYYEIKLLEKSLRYWIGIINDTDASEEDKKDKIEEIKKYNDFLYINSGHYASLTTKRYKKEIEVPVLKVLKSLEEELGFDAKLLKRSNGEYNINVSFSKDGRPSSFKSDSLEKSFKEIEIILSDSIYSKVYKYITFDNHNFNDYRIDEFPKDKNVYGITLIFSLN